MRQKTRFTNVAGMRQLAKMVSKRAHTNNSTEWGRTRPGHGQGRQGQTEADGHRDRQRDGRPIFDLNPRGQPVKSQLRLDYVRTPE